MTFSVIIPVYNVAPYLRECLDSVLAAARTLNEKCGERSEERGVDEKIGGESRWTADVEIICVDDGSTDGSGAILDEYVEKVEKLGGGGQRSLKVLHHPNRGVSAARNAALDVATGEWLVFLDSDDVLTPHALSRIREEIENEPRADVIRYENYRFGDGELCDPDVIPRGTVDLSSEIPADEMGGNTLITWHNVLRRSRCADIRFAPYVCGEDRLYTFECLQRMNILVHIPDRLYGYRCRSQSYTTSVKKTFRGWEGELAYRMDFLAKSVSSGKRIHYEGADWLVPYLAWQHVIGFMTSSALNTAEKRTLFDQWRREVPQLRRCPVFSTGQHLDIFVQSMMKTFSLMSVYVYLRCTVFGPRFFLRRFYRFVCGHGEFARA